MKCLYFSNGTKKEIQSSTRSPSGRSNGTTSMVQDTRPGSRFNSQNTSGTNANTSGRSELPGFFQKQNSLRVFTYLELKNATKNFSHALMIGEGGFGRVYRATIKNPEDPHATLEIAVKQLSQRGLQGHKEWLTEVNVLGVVDHPNLVKLVGYCAEDDARGMQRLLIYEFMPKRSVEDHLSTRSTEPLSWSMRLRIALDAARGLTYLHEEMDLQIIFRDLKTSNILLDEHWNAKLSDFGLARQGPAEGLSHVSTVVVGTIGYAAPEYMLTGHLTAKSDIWSYGVVLYELITGRRPLDTYRPKCEQKLLEWVKPYISDVKKFCTIIDPRLEGKYSLKSTQQLAAVANRCLMRRPRARPKMSEVLDMVNRIVESAETGTPEPPLIRDPSNEVSLEEEKSQGATLEVVGDLKMGERRRLVWQGWTLKLVHVSMVLTGR
uniref:non-specific serine/threonine protein kinase n=1 Tax=Anthurium amnicola TaxID=1678845 RepID=A0A1D1XDS1_9ARAE